MHSTMKYCRLKFKSFSFKCDVRLNDVSLVRLPAGQNLSTTFSVNEWIRKGENLLTVDLAGNDDDLPGSAMMRIDIGLTESVHEEAIDLLTVELGPQDANAGMVARPVLVAAMPFAEYDDHLLQPIDPADRDQMTAFLRVYGQYYQAMASKDIGKVMPYFEYRCAEYDRRYYAPATTRHTKLRTELEHSFKGEFLLQRVPELEKVNLHMAGRLLTMDYADDGNPLTTFTGEAGDYTRAYQAYWGRNSRGEFFIYR